jgi:hypothetical protein
MLDLGDSDYNNRHGIYIRARLDRQRVALMDSITYRAYSGEHELPHIISLVQGELSEPYVVYTYRYFLHQWLVPPPHSPDHPNS